MIARGRRAVQGFTILEVMIFLAISSLLFVSAIWVMGGKQAQVQFAQGVRDINSKIQDTINDVATGYFPKDESFNCTTPGVGNAPPVFSAPAANQGTNVECVFLGKAIEFTTSDSFYIYTIVGRRLNSAGAEVSTYSEANPKAVAQAGADLTVTGKMHWGITAQSLEDLSTPGSRGTVVFFSSLGQYNLGNLESGKQNVVYAVVPNSDISNPQPAAIAKIDNMTNGSGLSTNPPKGIQLCLADGSGRKATITIGGTDQIASSRLDIDGGAC